MTKKILIAEDEWELRNLLKLMLEDYDFEIIEAEDGEETINKAKETQPELILLDNNMPGLSGYEVIQQLKAIEELKTIPIIMLTGKRFDEEMQQMIKMDVHEFLPKPYEEKKIIAAVKKALGELPKKGAIPAVPTVPEIPIIPAELPPEQMQPVPSPSITPPEQHVSVAPEIPLPEMTIPEVPTEVPKISPEIPIPEIPTAEIPTVEIPLPIPPSIPSPEAIPEVSVPEVTPEVPPTEVSVPVVAAPESVTPTVPAEVTETKFYCVTKTTLRELITILSSDILPETLIEKRTSGAIPPQQTTIFVIAYGKKKPTSEDIQHLNMLIELFSNLPVVVIDHKTFRDKLQSIKQAGMELIEFNQTTFKKI